MDSTTQPTADEMLTAVCVWLERRAWGLRFDDKEACRTIERAADDLPFALDELREIIATQRKGKT